MIIRGRPKQLCSTLFQKWYRLHRAPSCVAEPRRAPPRLAGGPAWAHGANGVHGTHGMHGTHGTHGHGPPWAHEGLWFGIVSAGLRRIPRIVSDIPIYKTTSYITKKHI